MPLPVCFRSSLRLSVQNSRIDIWLLGEFRSIRKRINNVKNHAAWENATNSLTSAKTRLSRVARYIYIYILCGRLSNQAPIANIDRAPRSQRVCERLKSEVSEGGNVSVWFIRSCYWQTRCAPWKWNYVTSREFEYETLRLDLLS